MHISVIQFLLLILLLSQAFPADLPVAPLGFAALEWLTKPTAELLKTKEQTTQNFQARKHLSPNQLAELSDL